MNLGESLNLVATGLNSSAYSSILGNSFSQDILGLQTANSFGIKSDVFIDGIRLLEKIVIDATTNEVTYEPTTASKILEGAQKVFSLGGFGMFAGKLERNAKDAKKKFWVGSEMSIGDIAELNFMGDRLTANCGINDLEYNRPIEKLSSLSGGTTFDHTQHELETFFWVLWGAALITSLVFMGYSVAIAVDQSLADNTEWQIANSAMQIAQVIALTLLGIYERNFLSNAANAERDAAYSASNYATLQEFQTELDKLEGRMQGQIDSLGNQLNSWQATSKTDIEALTKEVQQQAKITAENKKDLQEQLQNDLNDLKKNLEKIITDVKENSADKQLVEELSKQLNALEKDVQDNKKDVRETEKRMNNALKKLEKKLSSLETKVADLDVTTNIEIEVIKKTTGDVIEVVQEVQEGFQDCSKRLDNTKKIVVSSFLGEFKRLLLLRERKKYATVVVVD